MALILKKHLRDLGAKPENLGSVVEGHDSEVREIPRSTSLKQVGSGNQAPPPQKPLTSLQKGHDRQKIIDANPIVDFLRARGVELHESGQNSESLVTQSCPAGRHLKKGHRPVSIDVKKGVWYCNDHKVGGSVIDWQAQEKHMTIPEAMQSLNGGQPESKAKVFVCAYDYVDENGKLLFQSVRYKVPPPKNKTFLQRYPNPGGGWTWNTKGIRRVLYHLPQVLAADTVIVVEGEKDADKLTELGFAATTNVGGAGNWKAEYDQFLKDKNVVVFGDIGDATGDGEKHTQSVLRSLIGKCKSLKHGIQPAHDIGDFIDSLPPDTDKRQSVQGLIDQAKHFDPTPDSAQRFKINDLESFNPMRDPKCLVGRRWLVRGGSCLWAGASGLGKSSLAIQIAMYLATGTPIFGWRPVRPLKSVITQAENDQGDVAEQWQGVKKGIASVGDLDLSTAQELFEQNVIIYRIVGKTGGEFLGILDQLLAQHRPELYWMDPMFAFSGCDLLNPEKAGHFLREGLFPIMLRHGCCANVIHHVGKPKQNGTDQVAEIDIQYLGFGTSEIQNAFRAINVILPVPTDPGLFKLTLSKRGERSGSKTPMGSPTTNIYLKHSTEGICWLQVDEPEPHDQKPKGRQAKYTEDDVTKHMSLLHAKKVSELLKNTAERGMSRATFFRIFDKLETAKKVEENADGWILKSQKSQKENQPF